MPPKGTKRGAPSPAGGARKKTNADPLGPKLKHVVHAIQQSDSLPDHCKEMLTGLVGTCLNVFAEERHDFQKQAVEMLRETLSGVQAQLQKVVEDSQAKVDSSERDKASRIAAQNEAQAQVVDLEKKATESKEAMEGAKEAVVAAKAKLKEADDAAETKDEEVKEMTELKTRLDTAMKDIYDAIKAAKGGKRQIHALEKVFREVGLEEGLIDSMDDTFQKEPEKRGTFDGLVAKSIETQVGKYTTETEATLSGAEQIKADFATAKSSAEAALNEADNQTKASVDAHNAAETALKEGKAALKQAESAVSNFERDIANVETSLEKAKNVLNSFNDDALASFTALKALAPPAEPEPQAAEPPAAEEPEAKAAEAAPDEAVVDA